MRTIAPPPCGWRDVVDGSALGRTPGAVTASETDAAEGVDRALVRILLVHDPPRDAGGEGGDRHRQEDDRLERDRPADALDEDGEDEPDAVTKAGTTATQIALFLIAVTSVEVVNSVL